MADLKLNRFGVGINVAVTFSLICFWAYFVAKKSLWEVFESPGAMIVFGITATFVVAQGVVVNLSRTSRATAVSDNTALIGAVVALGGVITAQMVSIALENRRAREARQLEVHRTQEARQLETQRAIEAALQRYFEDVGRLLIDRPLLRASPGEHLSTVVRAQTLSVLQRLDADRKRILLQFLYESGLIRRDKPVVSLTFADLRGAKLHWAFLQRADLSGADLSGADLRSADLREASLTEANLNGAILVGAIMRGADLSDAQGITYEELEQQAKTLEGATMPNGQKYEDWLKSKGGAEDGKSGGSP